MAEDVETPGAPVELPAVIGDRYERGELLGRGGMGEVWRVFDRVLDRGVAMKLVRLDAAAAATFRFMDEAKIAGQLQHPGIVPLYDVGSLPDGRSWFTMQEVRGQTLEDLVVEVHRAWRLGRPATADGMTFRRLLEIFLRICETVAYAHARGVVHRDLKLSNVMIGRWGEVYVLDWGLAKVLRGLAESGEEAVQVERQDAFQTRVGSIAGTPAYMAPEQARGESATVGAAADVYALGAMLFDICCERPPRIAGNVKRLIAMVAEGTPIRPPSELAEGMPIDDALDAICLRALETDPADRYPDAGALAAAMAEWLDGSQKRERAMALVRESDAARDTAVRAETEARRLAGESSLALEALEERADAEAKYDAWELEDRAKLATGEAVRMRSRSVDLLRSALTHAPELPEAHNRLADAFHRTHANFESERRLDEARAVEDQLRAHDRAGEYAAYLTGNGALTLVTDPEGAEVRLHRMELRNRRLVPIFERVLGTTPLVEVPLPRGNYALTLHLDGHRDVTYPVQVGRLEHWHGTPPDRTEPLPIRLPRLGELGADDCYVPAGWFWAGDEHFSTSLPLRRVWADAFVARRHPVTVGEFVTYLNALVDAGLTEDASRAEPRMPSTEEAFFGKRGGRYYGIRTDRDDWADIPKSPDAPLVLVTWHHAMAYAKWYAEHAAAAWRLGAEMEWQKAARGVDARDYPWGDFFEPQWCQMKQSARPLVFAPVTARPDDVSCFGVRGLAGNTKDWVLDPAEITDAQTASARVLTQVQESDMRVAMGGTATAGPLVCQTTIRWTQYGNHRGGALGMRLFRTFGETDPFPGSSSP